MSSSNEVIVKKRNRNKNVNVVETQRRKEIAAAIQRGNAKRLAPKNLFEHFIKFISSIANTLTPRQWVFILFLLMIGVSMAADVRNKTLETNERFKKNKDRMNDACRPQINTFNKPRNVTISLNKNLEDTPESCLKDPLSLQCQQEKLAVEAMDKKYSTYQMIVGEMRNSFKSQFLKDRLKSQVKTDQAKKGLTKTQLDEFDRQMRAITQAKLSAAYTKASKNVGGGFCEDNARVALNELVQLNAKEDWGLHIHHVLLRRNQPSSSHVFVLISDEPIATEDIKGKSQVRQKLVELRSGSKDIVLCDPWNPPDMQDSIKEFRDITNPYNTEEGEWDALEIENVTIYPDRVKKFAKNSDARKVMCEELNELGMLPENHAHCRLFQPLNDEKQAEVKTEKSLVI